MIDYFYCFVLNIESKHEDYGKASLFISKLVCGEDFSSEELNGIRYFRLSENNCIDCRNVLGQLNNQTLYPIKNCKNFNTMKSDIKYTIIFNIIYNDESDISELGNFILMKNFFRDTKVYSLISGNRKNYYKVSHYLMLYSMNDLFYDNIYYDYGFGLKRLQRKNIGILTDFLPLIHICEDNDFLNVFFEKRESGKIFNEEKKLINKSCDKLIEDFVKYIGKHVDGLTRKDIETVCHNASLMEKCLFCFLLDKQMHENEKDVIIENLWGLFYTVRQYSSCIRQITENVLFHSAIKQGVLSARTYSLEKHRKYLEKKYNSHYFKNNNGKYLEITISDYSGYIRNGNIPEHFINSLPEKYKSDFSKFALRDFFETNSKKIAKAWEEYYSDGDNLGKHYGLKMFNSLIYDANGMFFIETHSSHISSENDYYCSECDISVSEKLSPTGTYYNILLPVSDSGISMHSVFDVFMTSDIRIEWEKYLYYSNHEIKFMKLMDRISSSNEKNSIISAVTNSLRSFANKYTECDILQYNAENLSEYHAEIICKAIIIFLTIDLEKNMPHMAFYNCNDEFIKGFINVIKIFWNKSTFLSNKRFQIALIPKDKSMYTVIIPSSAAHTAAINKYISESRASTAEDFFNIYNYADEYISEIEIIPFEVLVKPYDCNDMTVFELYTRDILIRNVQEKSLGCKIEDTHMRLGSSIHIDDFYEAELLFNNKLFVSCFAFLLTKDIINANLTGNILLFGYASYSEMLVYNTKKLIEKASFKNEIMVESIILERDSDNRGIGHIDLIQQSSIDISVEQCTVIYIVPINSTMKTLGKMRDKLEETFKFEKKAYTAFALITISPMRGNSYWDFNSNRTIIPKNHLKDIFTEIKYYITAETTYNEAIVCKLCYPDNPIHEKPLIEVNASSTIPNQSFRLIDNNRKKFDYNIMDELQNNLEILDSLKDAMLYGHTFRGENHFLYYIKTEVLFKNCENKIISWLNDMKNDINTSKKGENVFNIIFCPMHYSNMNFVETVNDIVFNGVAMVIRVDVDKEYRSNFKAKFSNLSALEDNLKKMTGHYSIRVHYVDDTIITGRTYHRSKSIIASLFDKSNSCAVGNIKVFYSVILLLNRHSSDSMNEYIDFFADKTETKIFSFFNLKISSLRTHGNSCILCNLKRDANILRICASTEEMDKYWKEKLENSFNETLVTDFKKNYNEKAFLRLSCTHLVGEFLPILNAYESRETAMLAIVKLISCHLRANEQMNKNAHTEIFYSYIKVISRPFISFDKFIKEAVFDMLLILIEALLDKGEKNIEEYIISLTEDNVSKYPKTYSVSLSSDFNEMLKLSKINIKEYNEDFLRLLMKQMTELKSNYIIRVECMNKIIDYVSRNIDKESTITEEKKSFINFYANMVKRLVGTGSDTSKSVWFDYILLYGKEPDKFVPLIDNPMMKELVKILMIENTRVYFDAVEHLCQKITLKFNYADAQMTLKGMYEYIDSFVNKRPSEDKMKSFLDMLCGNSLVKTIVYNSSILQRNPVKDILEYLGKRFKYTYSDSNMGIYSDEFKEDSENIIDYIQSGDYIFENFRKVLNNIYDYNSNKDAETLEQKSGFENDQQLKNLIMASVHLLNYINHFDDTSENPDSAVTRRYKKLAVIIRELLSSNNVSIIIQNKASLDAWVEELCKKAEKRGLAFDDIIPENKYEYTILSSSNTLEYEDDEYCPVNLSQNIQKYFEKSLNEYYVGQNIFIWKIDSEGNHPVFIYADLDSTDKIRMVKVKCLMMMRNKLREKVFGINKNDYIHELVQERNELIIQKRNKSHTHTKNSELSYYYGKALLNKANEDNLAIIMTLLADLSVSETYRQSLSSNFYKYDIHCATIPWSESPFQLVNTFMYSDGRSVNVITDKKISEEYEGLFSDDILLNDNDSLITLDAATNEQKPMYFLLSMAQNASKFAFREKNEIPKVYISKTKDNTIRICNLISTNDSERHTKKIISSISNPPVTRDQGITMWSISRYIKAMTIKVAAEYIEKVNPNNYNQHLLKELFSNKYEINVITKKINDSISCLSIEIPLLQDKFNKYLLN